ncbi:MAG: acyl-CoA dehydrogenase family protein [Alphaproteobacteria bacterium]
MDFSLSDEQQLLKDSVDRFVRDRYGFDRRRALLDTPLGFDEANWRQMAELGWLAAPLPEAYGGIGGGAVEIMVLMEAFGRGLVLEPFFPSVVLGANLLLAAGSEAQKQELLPSMAAGETRLAFAWVEPHAGYDLFDVTCVARRDGGGWVLDGAKGVVLGAAAANRIVVLARTAGGQRDREGLSLFLVPQDAPGLRRRDYATQDGQRAADLSFEGVRLGAEALLGAADEALTTVETVAEHAIAALAAEAVGCMAVLVESTADYLKTREQFGRSIGSFQAVQHRAVDMFMAMEEARSMTYVATCRLGDADALRRAKAASGVKSTIGRAGRRIGQEAVQLHGGMGMTDELHVGHYFKRLTMIDIMFGNASWHLKRYAAL